jgi:peroxiredoxin
MRLKKGNRAPLFVKEDFLGNQIDFSHFKGKKILISFFRGASCPFCNLRVHELIKNTKVFEEKGLTIITFFSSSKEEIRKYAAKQNPPFSVIPDSTFRIYKKYGLESSVWGMFKAMMRIGTMIKMMNGGFFNLKTLTDKHTLPADILIDEELAIHKAYYGSDYGDHISFGTIQQWLNNN